LKRRTAMNIKKTIILGTGLVLVLAMNACTRHDVDQPSPVGPSTLATVLKVSANPNVINAGTHRAGTTISASLKMYDGSPLADRTVTFEICDAIHSRVNIGYFENQEGVLSRQTDSGGNITLTYYGPLNSDIEASTSVNIWATAAAEGNESIEDFAPINIIRDGSSSTVLLDLSADPNVLNAGTHRESATIMATVKSLDGTPLSNRTVYFEIDDANDERAHIGYFEGQNPVASRVTNSDGKASVKYFAPVKDEIGKSCVLHIWASTSGKGDPFIQKFVEVFIIR
jgi:hypothetical protein